MWIFHLLFYFIHQPTCYTTLRCHLVINPIKLSSRSKSPCSIPREVEGLHGLLHYMFHLSVFSMQGRNEEWNGRFSVSPDRIFSTQMAFGYTKKPIHQLITSCYSPHSSCKAELETFFFSFCFKHEA